MICSPGFIQTKMSAYSYKHKLTGQGESYHAHKCHHMTCLECNKNLTEQSLLTHLRGQHGMGSCLETPVLHPWLSLHLLPTLSASHSSYRGTCPCPVEGCSFSAQSWNLLHQHFVSFHPRDTIAIKEEGLLTPCELCGMQVTPYALE